MNCSDSIDFLIAMAHACGLSASKVHGYWNGIGHFWANVNGQKMDTTGWMLHRTWTPSQSHAGPSPYNETSNDDDEDDVTIIGLLLEIINILRGEQHMTVTHEGNVQYDFNHEITGDLPDGVTPEDVERIMDSHVEDSRFLKKISNNREFQERFDNMRRKLVRERERFS